MFKKNILILALLLPTACLPVDAWQSFKNSLLRIRETLRPKIAADITVNAQQTIAKTTGEIHQIVHDAKDAIQNMDKRFEVVIDPKMDAIERILQNPVVVQHEITGFNKETFDHVYKKIALGAVSFVLAGYGTTLLYQGTQQLTLRHLAAGCGLLGLGLGLIHNEHLISQLYTKLTHLCPRFFKQNPSPV